MNVDSLLTGGGSAAFVVALAYVGRLVFDWWKERGAGRSARSTAVTDAAAANAVLLASLKEEREEVQRLSAEVAELRTQNAALYQRQREQRAEFEREIASLRGQLDDLHERLRNDRP